MKTSKSIIICLSISFLLKANTLLSCGWFENSESVRLAFFRAEIPGMDEFRPFYYSADFYNSSTPGVEKKDQYKNCKEWQMKLGSDTKTEDIFFILYNTSPEAFELSYEKNQLKNNFEGNSFIEKLLLPKNKELLEYIKFSKELEYYNFQSADKWESWDKLDNSNWDYTVKIQNDYSALFKKFPAIKDDFLRTRYAFQFIKINYYSEQYEEAIKLYDDYFSNGNDKTILKPWALLYKALSLDRSGKNIQANYLYSLVFDQSEEKKYVAMQWFNKKPEAIEKTLALAKNDHERSVILSMQCLRDPGRSLSRLKEIAKYGPDDNYFGILVMREINKLEDWIFTPMLTEYGPSVSIDSDDEGWYNNFAETRKKNYVTDVAYSKELKEFLTNYQKSTKGDLKDLLSVAIAHLCFINDENETGRTFLKMIPANATPAILTQKNIQLSLIALKSENINSGQTQEKLTAYLRGLEDLAKVNYDTYKSLYSLSRIISKEYQKQKKIAVSGLLFLRSEHYKGLYESQKGNYYEDYSYLEGDYYWKIAYFDRYASTKDMDELISIITKKKPTSFESYMLEQNVAGVNALKDLKATIAFRNNNLELTEKTLAEIPENYWDTAYQFKDYLNEDPFLPKCLSYAYTRKFDYHFNKLRFIKQIRSLIADASKNDSKKAEDYLKIGHAYFNCSYWGNSWMMTNYGKGTDERYEYSNDYLFGPMYDMRTKMQNENYYKCAVAKQYYLSALKYAVNDEQKAMADLMIHCCNESAYEFGTDNLPSDKEPEKFVPEKELFDLYNNLSKTNVFMKYQCPGLDYYIASK